MIDINKYISTLKDCIKESIEDDRERPHLIADGILCELLTELGYANIVELYNKVNKWYS